VHMRLSRCSKRSNSSGASAWLIRSAQQHDARGASGRTPRLRFRARDRPTSSVLTCPAPAQRGRPPESPVTVLNSRFCSLVSGVRAVRHCPRRRMNAAGAMKGRGGRRNQRPVTASVVPCRRNSAPMPASNSARQIVARNSAEITGSWPEAPEPNSDHQRKDARCRQGRAEATPASGDRARQQPDRSEPEAGATSRSASSGSRRHVLLRPDIAHARILRPEAQDRALLPHTRKKEIRLAPA